MLAVTLTTVLSVGPGCIGASGVTSGVDLGSSPQATAPSMTRTAEILSRVIVRSSFQISNHSKAVFDASQHGHADRIGKDFDAVLASHEALIEQVAARQLELQVAGQRLRDRQI